MKTLLLFGFEPFDGRPVNASEAIVRAIGDATIEGYAVVGIVLPCVFGDATRMLTRAIRRHNPALVIGLGEAGRTTITPERVAINVDDARIPDNAGRRPVDRRIARLGPAAYFSTLPIKAMTRAIAKRGLPVAVSQTAGTFVCNHVYYGLMHELVRRRPHVRGGFIHVPCLTGARRRRRPPTLDQMTDAIRAAIKTSIRYRRDITRAAGREE
jgi:pyroglutamyl-peptidase